MRKAAGIALSGIGILILILGILLGTVWRPAAEISGSTKPAGAGYVVTAPGVLDLTNRSVHIVVEAPKDDEIRFATGHFDDVKAFTAGYTTQSIDGVSAVDSLKVSSSQGKDPEGDLTEADVWLVKKSGEGSLDVDYTVTLPGQEVFIVSTASGAMPKVTLTWQRSVAPSLAEPTGLIGVLLLLAGILVFALAVQRQTAERRTRRVEQEKRDRREVTRRAETAVLPKIQVSDDELGTDAPARPGAEKAAESSAGAAQDASSTGAGDDSAETGDEEAAPALERAELSRATGGMLGVGIIPTSTRTEEIREREYSPEAIAEAESAWKMKTSQEASLNKSKSSTWWKFWGSKGEADKDA